LSGEAVWDQVGVSVRMVSAHAQMAGRVAPVWVCCWRTAQAAVLQPYQPYQRYVT